MILTDDHLHTSFSDGKNTPEEMIKEAISLGLDRITFTDHVRKESDWHNEYIDEIRRLKDKYIGYLEIGIAVECKILDFNGTLDCPPDLLNNRTVSKVAALHRIPKDLGGFIDRQQISMKPNLARECYLKALLGLKYSGFVSRIAHPFSLVPFMEIKEADIAFWNQIYDTLNIVRIPIEYNVKYDNSKVPSHIWKSFQNMLYFGTDSHSIDEMRQRNNDLVQIEKKYKVMKWDLAY